MVLKSSWVEVTSKTIIAVAAAFLLTAGPSFGQQAHDDGPLQQLLSGLGACVRSHAAGVYALGIRATRDAEELLLDRCGKTVLNDLFGSIALNERAANERATSKLPAVPPGIFRVTVREEWAAFLDGASGR
jgi:hypothetical protein